MGLVFCWKNFPCDKPQHKKLSEIIFETDFCKKPPKKRKTTQKLIDKLSNCNAQKKFIGFFIFLAKISCRNKPQPLSFFIMQIFLQKIFKISIIPHLSTAKSKLIPRYFAILTFTINYYDKRGEKAKLSQDSLRIFAKQKAQ